MDKQDWREVDRTGLSAAWRVVAVIVAVTLVGVGLVFVTGGAKWITAEFRGEVSQREKTRADGDYRIQAYDAFFDDCNAIKAKERIIARYEERIEDEGPSELLQAAVMAESNVREELIAAYNADAAKEDTRGHFRSSGLPYEIDPEGETTCAA